MRHLVVARERRVHGGPASHHVGENARDDQVAHEDAHRSSDERVDAAPVPARPDVSADCAQRSRPFEDDLEPEENERAGHVVAVREERPVAGVRLLLLVHPADREDHVFGLAREQVPRLAPPSARSPIPVPRRRSISAQSGGAEHVMSRRGLLLHPAEGRDVLVRPEQDPGLTCTRLRGEIRLPFGQLVRVVGDPARHVRRVSVSHGAAQHGQREPVDLEVDDPRNVRARDDPLPFRDPLRDSDRRRVVGAEDDGEDDAHRRHDERGQQGPAEVVDREHVVERLRCQLEDEGVGDQYEQEAEHERQRQAHRGENRRDHRVERRYDDGDDERTPEARELHSGEERRGHHERNARGEPRDDEREQLPARPLGLPGHGPAVSRLGAVSHRCLLLVARPHRRRPRRCGRGGTARGRTPRARPSSPPSSRRAPLSARQP